MKVGRYRGYRPACCLPEANDLDALNEQLRSGRIASRNRTISGEDDRWASQMEAARNCRRCAESF